MTFLGAAVISLGLGLSTAVAVPLTNSPGTVGPISSSGNTFSNIGCNIVGPVGFALPFNCNQIDATSTGGNLNLQSFFQATGGLGVSAVDVLITYSVSSLSPISDIDLVFNGSFFGLAIASVTETVFSAQGGQIVGQLTVTCAPGTCDLQDPPLEVNDIPLSGSFTSLYVTKDILLAADVLSGSTISFIGQSFHNVNVPEPASLALLGFGLLGLAFARRMNGAREL